jgi:hypothetical protein
LIFNILERDPNISLETRLFAEDLYYLFLKKKLRNYEGVRAFSYSHKLSPEEAELFFSARTAQYRGDFIGFIQALLESSTITKFPKDIFYNQEGSLFNSLVMIDKLILKHPGKLFFEVS